MENSLPSDLTLCFCSDHSGSTSPREHERACQTHYCRASFWLQPYKLIWLSICVHFELEQKALRNNPSTSEECRLFLKKCPGSPNHNWCEQKRNGAAWLMIHTELHECFFFVCPITVWRKTNGDAPEVVWRRTSVWRVNRLQTQRWSRVMWRGWVRGPGLKALQIKIWS